MPSPRRVSTKARGNRIRGQIEKALDVFNVKGFVCFLDVLIFISYPRVRCVVYYTDNFLKVNLIVVDFHKYFRLHSIFYSLQR